MSTVVVGGGGPRPQSRIVSVTEMSSLDTTSYEIRDGHEVLACFSKLSHAQALLPLIQSGE